MDESASGNDPQVQRSRSSIARGKQPLDGPPHPDVSKPADSENSDDDTEECARKATETQALRYNPLEGPNICLITINPAIQDRKLKITIEQKPLTDRLNFHILSYV
jgi:hypothetical protein